MSEQDKIELDKLLDKYFLTCGISNPTGLNLKFYCISDAVCSDIILEKVHEGWQNMAHGGIISTLLDVVMAWAIFYFMRVLFVTRKIEIKYIKPVLIGSPLKIRGRLIDASDPPKIRARGEILDDKGRLLVKGNGEFVKLTKEKLTFVPEVVKEEMFNLLEIFK